LYRHWRVRAPKKATVEAAKSSMDHENETESWLRIATRRVVGVFLDALAHSHGWKKVYVISPWISVFDESVAGRMSFHQLLKRLSDDDATAYVVSRPPMDTWHDSAIKQLASTGKANIALVPYLHTKLYCADTAQGSFALVGSANFTEKSLKGREIGVLIRESGQGREIVRTLTHEAADIYRSPSRKVFCKRKLRMGE